MFWHVSWPASCPENEEITSLNYYKSKFSVHVMDVIHYRAPLADDDSYVFVTFFPTDVNSDTNPPHSTL